MLFKINMTIKKKREIRLLLLIVAMISYILWVFYISEPVYINNLQNKKLEVYDYVSISKYRNTYDQEEMVNGIILQLDNETALLLVKNYGDKYYQLNLKSHHYRIVGRGTIYHKVNQYVGFNIMLITQICIGILTAVLIITTVSTLKQFVIQEYDF